MKLRAGSKALIREINEALVLDVVRAQAPVARGVIAAQTGLSPATVTGITAQLLRAGLLAETDAVRSTGGRPARLLRLGVDAVFAAGVRVSTTEAVAALVDLGGEIVATRREALRSTAPDDVVEAIARAVEGLAAGRTAGELIGVGVAISGMVDLAGGTVRHSGSMDWEDVPFGPLLGERLDLPVRVDSYVNSIASGELLFDAELEGRDILVFSIGTSLGASLVVGGRIHQGHAGAAGGFAHWRVGHGTAAPRPCHCGAVDCLESWSSAWGIGREFERHGVDPATAGAELVDRVYGDAALHLGESMANAGKMFGPERVIMAFAPEADRDRLATATATAFAAQFTHEHAPAPALEVVNADPLDLARGAAYIVLAQLFSADVSSPGWAEPAIAGDESVLYANRVASR